MRSEMDTDYYWADVYDDSDVTLYYDKDKNVMMDDAGFVVFDIFHIISPNTLYLFKTKKEDMFVYGTDGQPVVLIYSTPNDFIYG